jgi:hypothetical protein
VQGTSYKRAQAKGGKIMERRSMLLLMLLLICGSLVAMPVAADSTTYQDPGGAYSVTLPDGWKASVDSDTTTFGDGATPMTILLKIRPANGASLADAFAQDVDALAKDPNLQANATSDQTVGGQPAKRVSYRTLDGFPILPGVITVISKDTVYSIGYLTESESAAEGPLSTFLGSWQFT